MTVRLVKGAYWDAETIQARAEGWPVPVFEDKAETDANYERCVRLLHDHHGQVRAAFASHNLRSLAYAITYARQPGIPDTGYEIQMLHGMAEPMHPAIRRLGPAARVYAPVGELVPGWPTSCAGCSRTPNESFVRHRFAEGRRLDELIAAARSRRAPARHSARGAAADRLRRSRAVPPEPVAEWRRPSARAAMAAAVASVDGDLGGRSPALIAGERVATTGTIASVDPSAPDVAVPPAAACGVAEADAAVAAAVDTAEAGATPCRRGAAVLFRAAEHLRARRHAIVAACRLRRQRLLACHRHRRH